MAPKLPALLVLALLALPLTTVTARGDETPPAATAASTTSLSKNVCEITGIVAKVETVDHSLYSDGAPSSLSTIETDISVSVKERAPHSKDAPADSVCRKSATGEIATYKLCSPTPVHVGQRIHATEGTQTGSSKSRGCLFDIKVVPPATANGKI